MISARRALHAPSVLVIATAVVVSVVAASPAAGDNVDPATVSTTPAPDGVWVDWNDVDTNGYYRLTRTVDDSTTSQVVYGSHFADTGLQPGQEATYSVAAYSGGGAPSSAPVTGRRPLEGWSAPPGAASAAVIGQTRIAANPITPAATPRLRWDELSEVGEYYGLGVAFGRIPGPGTYDLSDSPASGEIRLASDAGCDAYPPPRPALHGTVQVYDVVYGASGTPLELGADFVWTCDGGAERRASVRINSPEPFARVRAQAAPRFKVEEGKSAQATWRVTNSGSKAAQVTLADISKGQLDASDCTGAPLDPGASCTLLATIPGTGAEIDYYDVAAEVDGQPGVGGMGEFSVVAPLSPPAVHLDARLPHAAEIAWEGGAPGVGNFVAYRVEQRMPDNTWAQIGETTGYRWTARNLTAGQTTGFRVSVRNDLDEVSEPSAAVEVTTPSEGLLWLDPYDLRGTSNLTDPGSVLVLNVAQGNFVRGMDVAHDRRHIVVTTSNNATSRSQVLIADLTDGVPHLVYDIPAGQRDFTSPRISPDGRRVAFTDGTSPALVDVATGMRTDLNMYTGETVGWSPDGARMLLLNRPLQSPLSATDLRWINANNVYLATALAGTAGASGADVSRTGAVAFTVPTATGGQVSLVPSQGGAPATVWSPDGCSVSEPRFDPTGNRLVVLVGGRGCGLGQGRFVLGLPASGPVTDVQPFIAQSTGPVAWVAPASSAPAVKVSMPTFTATTAPAAVTASDPDDPVGSLTRRCRLDAGAWTNCPASWAGLKAGPHTVEAQAIDPTGLSSAVASSSWTVDATAPTAGLTAPPSTLFTTSVALRWSGTDSGSGVAGYDLRVRYASPYGGFGSYVYPAGWQGLRTTSLTVSLSQGYTYCYSVRARDKVGNVGSWSTERCTTTVLDDRALTASSGFVRGTSASYAYGTFTLARSTARTLTRTSVQARRIGIVVTTCATCGSLEITHAGVKLGRISLVTSTTMAKQIRWLPLQATTRRGTLTITTLSSRVTYVDGIVVQH